MSTLGIILAVVGGAIFVAIVVWFIRFGRQLDRDEAETVTRDSDPSQQ